MAEKRRIYAQPDEKQAGEFAFRFYERTHQVRGDDREIEAHKKILRGLGGKKIRAIFHGEHNDPDTGESRRWRVSHEFKLTRYRDLFGRGSAYSDVLGHIKGKWSDQELVFLYVEIEEVDE